MTEENRRNSFMRKIQRQSNGYWIWQKSQNGDGYGRLWAENRFMLAHHFLLNPRPDTTKGEVACHLCNNRLCVNPKHIYIGTRSDNMHDYALSKGNRQFTDAIERNHKHQLTNV